MKARKRTVQWLLLYMWPVRTQGKELRADSNSVLRLWAVETHGKVVHCWGRGEGWKARVKVRENTRRKEKAKLAKAGGGVRKEREKERDSTA